MSRLLAKAGPMLNRTMAVGANTITCKKNAAADSITLAGWRGSAGKRSEETNVADYNARLGHEDRDYSGPIDELELNSVAFLPVIGMRFTESINGTSCVYECVKLPGGQEWDWIDAEKTRVRVHTKLQVT